MGTQGTVGRMRVFLVAILLLMFRSSVYGGEQGRVSSLENGQRKTFTYTAKKFGIPILKATIQVGNGYSEEGKRFYKVEAQVISLKIPGFMFRMNNRFTSLMEMDPFSPVQYVKEIDQEGLFIKRKNYVQTITFSSSPPKAIVEKKKTGEKSEILFPSHACDPLALFVRYHLKEKLPLSQEVQMSIFDGVKFRQMVFYSKKTQVKSDILGEVEAVCLESTTAFSSFGEKEGNIRIWYTANGDRIPIFMELDLPVGLVRFELEEMKEG